MLAGQSDKQVTGHVYGIDKSLYTANRLMRVHARIHNVVPLNLLAGAYVAALIEKGKALVPAVPKEAVVTTNNKYYIFVLEEVKKETLRGEEQKEAGKEEPAERYHFKMVEVNPGVEELGFVEIKPVEDVGQKQRL